MLMGRLLSGQKVAPRIQKERDRSGFPSLVINSLIFIVVFSLQQKKK
jgi:hypothetical protein